MNDTELSQLLKSAKVPERGPDHWAEFPDRVSAALRATRASQAGPPRLWPKLAWGFSLAGTCVLIGFVIGHWRDVREANGLLRNGKLVREVVAMFPNQVQAIIQDENGLRLSLAETPNVPQSQPLWINICDGKNCRSIVTFSGQTVQIDGHRVEALADASGGVMLVGEHFFWSAGDRTPGRLRINAQQLNQVL